MIRDLREEYLLMDREEILAASENAADKATKTTRTKMAQAFFMNQ